MEREDSNITRKALLNETFMGLKGLDYECKQLTDKLRLPNILLNQDLKEEMQNSKKVGDRWTENPMDNAYIHVSINMDEIQRKIHRRSQRQ